MKSGGIVRKTIFYIVSVLTVAGGIMAIVYSKNPFVVPYILSGLMIMSGILVIVHSKLHPSVVERAKVVETVKVMEGVKIILVGLVFVLLLLTKSLF